LFNPVFTDPDNELLKERLARVAEEPRSVTFATREEYQAEVFSRINKVLALGNRMLPVVPIGNAGPAIIGDITDNTTALNDSIEDISKEVLRIEGIAAKLFNLAAASQNSLRQQIRERINGSTSRRYIESFIHGRNIAEKIATVDFSAGVAQLPLIQEQDLTDQCVITVGGNSIGSLVAGTSNLVDSRVETFLDWNGSVLELICSFTAPQIINRLNLELDDYQGLEISTLSTSSDGTLTEDVLEDLGIKRILMNGTSGKFSGDVSIDFPARHVSQMRIVIRDLVGESKIALRSMSFLQRSYEASGRIKSNPVSNLSGKIRFTTNQLQSKPVTTITHQISYNGVDFTVIQPGAEFTLTSAPFWYRALLGRDTSKAIDNPLVNLDPKENVDYQLRTSSTTPLGTGIVQRTLTFDTVTGPVRFRETPLDGTFKVQEGSLVFGLRGLCLRRKRTKLCNC
jgi:hypothetical protein